MSYNGEDLVYDPELDEERQTRETLTVERKPRTHRYPREAARMSDADAESFIQELVVQGASPARARAAVNAFRRGDPLGGGTTHRHREPGDPPNRPGLHGHQTSHGSLWDGSAGAVGHRPYSILPARSRER